MRRWFRFQSVLKNKGHSRRLACGYPPRWRPPCGWGLSGVVALSLSGCGGEAADAVHQPFQLTATIQDLMRSEVDVSADQLWDAVSTEVTAQGEIINEPRDEESWSRLRNAAIVLTEASNLLLMDGRKVVAEGKEVEDAHVTGIRNAAEIAAAIKSDPAAWQGFVMSLHAAGSEIIRSIDARDAQRLLHAGEALDQVCEACHLKYWYPGQVIPSR